MRALQYVVRLLHPSGDPLGLARHVSCQPRPSRSVNTISSWPMSWKRQVRALQYVVRLLHPSGDPLGLARHVSCQPRPSRSVNTMSRNVGPRSSNSAVCLGGTLAQQHVASPAIPHTMGTRSLKVAMLSSLTSGARWVVGLC